MNSMNQVILIGNLTRDPELRKIPSGKAVADLGLAVNDGYKDKDGKAVERTVFVDVVTWDRQAETCAEFLKKGAPVAVEGKLQLDQWQTDSGEKRNKLRVRAQRVHFLGRPAKSKAEAEPKPSQKADIPDEEEVPF